MAGFQRCNMAARILFLTVMLAISNRARPCPEGCEYCNVKYSSLNKTLALVRARCSHNRDMVNIPQDLPTNLGMLLFKSNNLANLTIVSFNKFPYLQGIDLSNNRIEDIENGTFLKQRLLTQLVLQDNKLTKLTPEMFHSLKALEKLHLQKNSISGLQRGVFSSLKSLRVLKLHDNDLKRIVNGTFIGLDYLEELDLSGNCIKELADESLGNLMSLKIINLSYNAIKTVHEQTFSCTPLLKIMHINNNNLTTIPSIRQLEFLQELDVSNNPIYHIYTQSFVRNYMLQKINLSFCELTFFEKEILAGLKNLQMISLEGNPFHCNCRIQWLHYLLETKTELFSKANQISCKTPQRLEGKTIKNVKTTNFKCSCRDCQVYTACHNKGEQCTCTPGLEYITCEGICTPTSKTYNCTYINRKCLCDSPSSVTTKPRQCNFHITNKTCSKHAQLQKVGQNLGCVCKKGFSGDGVKCIDIDECLSPFRRCITKMYVCHNTVGSYKCRCRPGYKESQLFPQQQCVDVNECRNRSICGEHGICFNTEGICNSIYFLVSFSLSLNIVISSIHTWHEVMMLDFCTPDSILL